MAIDPTSPPTLSPAYEAPVIENEIPAYRAVSAGAVGSLILGLGSVFCYVTFAFLLMAVASIALGLLSLKKIRRFPEVLTGAGIARAGIGLGLLFGLTSITNVVLGAYLLQREAAQFASTFVEVLKDKSLSTAVWYQQPPNVRKAKGPDEVVEDLKKMKNPSTPDVYGERTASIRMIKERIKGPGERIHFSKIESSVADGLTQYAHALIDLDGPGSKEFPEKEQFALLQLMKLPGGGRNDWFIKDIQFPYKPMSVVASPIAKKDDGHGH